MPRDLILASGSRTRLDMLLKAGVPVRAEPADIDEDSVKDAFRQEYRSIAECAATLATLKARKISARFPEAIVIGADQMLEVDGAWFSKPASAEQARRQLQHLRGKRHVLFSAVVAVSDSDEMWQSVDEARLTMRGFSDRFLDDYLLRIDPSVLSTAGCYQIEGLGAQLFDRVEGDHFTILGLPLLPLLVFLRSQGLLLP